MRSSGTPAPLRLRHMLWVITRYLIARVLHQLQPHTDNAACSAHVWPCDPPCVCVSHALDWVLAPASYPIQIPHIADQAAATLSCPKAFDIIQPQVYA